MYLLTRFISNILSSEENFITQTNKVRYTYETFYNIDVIKLSTLGTSTFAYHVDEDWINFGYYKEDDNNSFIKNWINKRCVIKIPKGLRVYTDEELVFILGKKYTDETLKECLKIDDKFYDDYIEFLKVNSHV